MLIKTKENAGLGDSNQEKKITTVHSILILILLLQITLITLGFYVWFVYMIQQNQSFENQIIQVIAHTLNKLASQKPRYERSVTILNTTKLTETLKLNQTELMANVSDCSKFSQSICSQCPKEEKRPNPYTTSGLETDCLLKRVGIPLYNGMVKDFNYGAYLRDPMPRKKGFTEKIWLTFGYLNNTLLEYDSLDEINSNNVLPKIYYLPSFFYGTGHIIYQGALFYHSYNTRNLIKYDLHLNRITALLVLDLSHNDTVEEKCRVYSDHRDHVGCVDFNVDENGVWLIYRNASRQSIFVASLNVEDLSIQKRIIIRFGNKESPVKFLSNKKSSLHRFNSFSSSLGLEDILNGFIICGKIYFLQYHVSKNTVIRLMFDLYNLENQFSYLKSIDFIQPYKKNTQLTYNPFDQKLYAWDSEHLITYSLDL